MRRRVAFAFIALLVGGCAGDVVSPTLAGDGELQVRPALVRMVAGESRALDVVAFDTAGDPVFPGDVAWSSLDADLVAVDTAGVVTAHAPGWARIVARSVATGLADTAVVASGLRFTALAGGRDVACGWTTDGTAYCWGGDPLGARAGMLGTGAVPTAYTPAPVAGGLAFTAIDLAAEHACGIAGGDVYCWGASASGARGTRVCSVFDFGCHTPERAEVEGTFEHVAVSTFVDGVSCASGPGGLYCWGRGPLAAPAGDCMYCLPQQISPALVGPVHAGEQHVCALDASGRAFCRGDNSFGQLGAEIPHAACTNTDCTWTHTPVPVATTSHFTDLAGGDQYTCGLATDGRAFCWGAYARYATLHDADRRPGIVPVQVGGSLRFQSIAGGNGHACAITPEGELYCWGDAAHTGALGEPLLPYPEVVHEPRRVGEGMTFTAVAATGAATCAITQSGATVCLGTSSSNGQGAFGITTTSPIPIAPPGPLPQ